MRVREVGVDKPRDEIANAYVVLHTIHLESLVPLFVYVDYRHTLPLRK